MELELIKTFVTYHIEMTRRVWDSIEQISEEQFLADDVYSRGSIRNLMVHLTSADRRWLSGLKNLAVADHLKFEEFPTRDSAREVSERVARDFGEYTGNLSAAELMQNPERIPNPRWAVVLQVVNHGTDHRATILERLTQLGAPTFDQDFISWLWSWK